MRSNMTGVGYCNSDSRSFNHGFARGISKPFQQSQRHPSPQPSRKGGDLFMEAGRLAVEYLVSRGLLSSNVLSEKYQNGNLRKNSEELNDHRSSQDKDSSRSSSLDRDEKNRLRDRRRLGPSRSYSLDRTYENGKDGCLIEGAFPLTTMEVDGNDGHKDATSKNTDFKDDNHSELRNDNGKNFHFDNIGLKMTSLVRNKDAEEVMKSSNVIEFKVTKIGMDNHDKEKNIIMHSLAVEQGEETSSDSKENNVGTNGFDSVDNKNLNAMNDSEALHSSKTLGSGASDHSFEENEMVNPGYSVDEQKSVEPLEFGMLCGTIGKDRGEKRPIEEDNFMEGAKKRKQQWLSVAQSDEFSQLSDLSVKHSVLPAKSAINIFDVSGGQERFTNVSLPLKGCFESDINQGEKQLFPNSFKICDLNLMGASDMPENHEVPLLYRTISGPSQDFPVNVDLSMRNNGTGSLREGIEIIDLESASLAGCKSSNTSMKKVEAGMTTTENVLNLQNDPENPYKVPNCSSVQPDTNSLHNDMGLNHAQGMYSEDDPIYMSLGEIPLTGFLRAWEQPTQERNPFEP